MIGKRKARQESLFAPVRRETRVAKELRELKELVSFDWLREACRDKFCHDNGRPSIAPEVLGAMMFLGFWYNITSDRELCEECEDRLSFREFIGISDEEAIPVHSSLTHWRQRLGREVFRGFLEYTLQVARDKGLRPGRCRMFDSTLVKAQADPGGPGTVEIDPVEQANDYLDALGEWDDPILPGDEENSQQGKKGGSGWKHEEAKRRIRDRVKLKVSNHDPDAKLLWKPNQKASFYHKCHFEFDASSGLVINADVGQLPDAFKMVEFLSKEEYPVDTVAGDCGYFTMESQTWLKDQGITSMISVHDKSNNGGRVFGLDAFTYVDERDEYICPAGHVLKRYGNVCSGKTRYRIGKNLCPGCQMRCYCFRGDEGGKQRELAVHEERPVVEEAIARNRCWRYMRLRKRRSILCEGSFGTMKGYGGLGRARGLGEEAMAIQSLMAGGIHNIKKVLKYVRTQARKAHEAIFAALSAVYAATDVLLVSISGGRQQILEESVACRLSQVNLSPGRGVIEHSLSARPLRRC